MSTRSTTHFIDSTDIDETTKKPHLSAIIYRHTDGYPEGAGKDIYAFLERVSKLRDTRLSDSSYLAAKYVVFLASMFAAKDNPLDFLSVGVMSEDPMDMAYRYVIDCGKLDANGWPEVRCYDRRGKEYDIPR